MSFKLSVCTFFDIEVIYLQALLFKVIINLSATTDVPSLCVEYICHSMSFFSWIY